MLVGDDMNLMLLFALWETLFEETMGPIWLIIVAWQTHG